MKFMEGYNNFVNIFKNIKSYSEGFAAVKLKDGKWAYLDKNDNLSAERYDYAGQFKNGLASVRIGETWFFVDKERNMFEF